MSFIVQFSRCDFEKACARSQPSTVSVSFMVQFCDFEKACARSQPSTVSVSFMVQFHDVILKKHVRQVSLRCLCEVYGAVFTM